MHDRSTYKSSRADENVLEKPRYLQSISENNSPRYDWGPKKRVNQYGLYSHLSRTETNVDLASNTFSNENFEEDEQSRRRETELIAIRF